MNLEQQVVSLELAKKMKELGFEQESYAYWKKDGGKHYLILRNSRYYFSKGKILASAYTVSELGEMLPKGSYSLLTEYDGKWSWQVKTPVGSFVNGFQSDMTEADARAKMLIYLAEDNLI